MYKTAAKTMKAGGCRGVINAGTQSTLTRGLIREVKAALIPGLSIPLHI